MAIKTTRFGTAMNGSLALEVLYAVTAIALAVSISLYVPRAKPTDNRFPACFTNVCFA